MTVSSTSSRIVFVGGENSATSFSVPFKIDRPTDLVAVYTDLTGTDFTLSPSQYTATGFGQDAGCVVTYPLSGPPLAAGAKLTVYRDVAVTQPTAISNQGAMWPQVIEAALDRLTYIAQRVADSVSRSLVISPTDNGGLRALPDTATRANSVLAFDAAGQPYAATLTGSVVGVANWLINFLSSATTASGACQALGAAQLGAVNAFTAANNFAAGLTLPTRDVGDNGLNGASTAFVATAIANARTASIGGAVPWSYLSGLGLSNAGAAPNTSIGVAAGVCADTGNTRMLSLEAGVIDCTTTGANGLATGSLAVSTWYHVFAIGTANGATARLASTSADAPVLPTGYTLFRRIGAFKTDASANIIPFTQNGDEFLWVTPKSVVDDSGVAFPTTLTNLSMVVPTGVAVTAIFSGLFGSTALVQIAVSSNAQTGSASAQTNAAAHSSGGTLYGLFRTDLQGRIQWVANGAGTSQTRRIYTYGWIDRRGRDV